MSIFARTKKEMFHVNFVTVKNIVMMINEEILLSLDWYQFYYLRLNGLLPGQKAVPYYSWHCKKQRINKKKYIINSMCRTIPRTKGWALFGL
jgi:hypothetical protein